MAGFMDFENKLAEIGGSIKLLRNEPLSRHTSFKIGGPAAVMAFPASVEELSVLLKLSADLDISPFILGAGTNVLAPDAGIDGVVICLKDCLNGMRELDGNRIEVMAGVTLSRAAVFAANLGLAGMEFAHGIPGTVGGGVYMNAGAYGGELCQICESVDVMTVDGKLEHYTCQQMEFGYRHSVLEDKGGIVTKAVFALQKGEPQVIRDKMKELIGKRSASQPLDLPSAGSAFKRPVGGYAAALIDQAGLKGFRIGDAAVSEKHAGFVVNLGSATADDVKQLLAEVAKRVYDNSGIRIEPEVRIW
jgi:UDP-N-acetylmuramate dehydrogenase